MTEDVPNNNENGTLESLEKALVQKDPKIFDGIPKTQRKEIIKKVAFSVQQFTVQHTHMGPLPDPDTLAKYTSLIPNGAERIMLMAEKQSDHRMKLESMVVTSQIKQSNLGQIFAFLIGLAALGASTYCIISGYEWGGSILGVGGLTSLVTAFIKGRSQQEKSLAEKRPRPIKK
jgi:uncharacterized membrane protein